MKLDREKNRIIGPSPYMKKKSERYNRPYEYYGEYGVLWIIPKFRKILLNGDNEILGVNCDNGKNVKITINPQNRGYWEYI